jgi:hypothetical protein
MVSSDWLGIGSFRITSNDEYRLLALPTRPPWISLIVPSNKLPPRIRRKNLGGFISASSGDLPS